MNPIEELSLLVRAREPIIYIVSQEEQRVLDAIKVIASIPAKLDKDTLYAKRLYLWDSMEGLLVQKDGNEPVDSKTTRKSLLPDYRPVIPPDTHSDGEALTDPLPALDFILKDDQAAIYVFNWLHHYVKDIHVMRMLARVAAAFRASLKTLILVSPVRELPPELERLITVYDYPLPDEQELARLTKRRLESLKLKTGCVTLSPDEVERVVKAARGLTLVQADKAISKWMVQHEGHIQQADTRRIFLEKAQLIRNSGFFEVIETTESLDDFGGYDVLKAMLCQIFVRFGDDARAYPLPYPKGIALVGQPGVGKTYLSKAIAGFVDFMLLRMDMGSFFGPLLGQSESQLNQGLLQIEACSPCVLLCDEYEKIFGKSPAQETSSTPTEGRVTAKWLYWMQECQKPIFRIASINHPERVDPEHLRQGRWDEIVFLDLPTTDERKQIFAIHLRKRTRDPQAFAIEELAKASKDFTGSEIEQAVIRGMTRAFSENRREVLTQDIYEAIRGTTPLAVSRAHDIEAIRKWAEKAHAVRASAPELDHQAQIRHEIQDLGIEI